MLPAGPFKTSLETTNLFAGVSPALEANTLANAHGPPAPHVSGPLCKLTVHQEQHDGLRVGEIKGSMDKTRVEIRTVPRTGSAPLRL